MRMDYGKPWEALTGIMEQWGSTEVAIGAALIGIGVRLMSVSAANGLPRRRPT